MDFSFSEEQQEIRSTLKKLLAEVVTDTELKGLAKEGRWFCEKAWKALADAGMLGLAVPEAHGGAGMGLMELVLLLQQVGRTVAPIPAVWSLLAAGRAIEASGSEAQKAAYLPGIASGETILTAALVNYDTTDAKRPTAVARPDGDGLRISGTFTNVAFVAQASKVLLGARDGEGYALVLVDPKAAGVTASAQVGTNGEPLTELVLADVVVPAADVLARGAAGAAALARLVDETVLGFCALAHGVSEGALFMTATYAKERKQFGVPIGTFQGVTQRLGDAYIDVDAMKVTVLQAAWRMAAGLPYANELSVAKFWAAEGGARVVAAAQHIHGGMGFDRDYPLHRYFLTSKLLEFTFGGAEAQLSALGRSIAAHA